jgi:structural maintenance of chromosome 1
MGKLYQLEIENFKSYGGVQIVGPFDDFTCVIGPNGSGKSNLMDAISFVLGVQSRFLRSGQLSDLIFRKTSGPGTIRKASVKLYYKVSPEEVSNKHEGELLVFCRSVSASGVSSYRLDGKDTTYDHYEEVLQSIGVLVKVRNFLVFQGDVESIAAKSSLELSKLIEHICGSDGHSADYDDLRRKKDEAEESTVFVVQKKKMFLSQCREVKTQKDEAELFQHKKHELQASISKHLMWKLWGLQRTILFHQNSVKVINEEILRCSVNLQDSSNLLSVAKSAASRTASTFASLDKAINKQKLEKERLETKTLPVRNKMQLLKRRLASDELRGKKLTSEVREKESLVAELGKQLRDSESKLLTCQQRLGELSLPSIQLSEAQIRKYRSLKEDSAVRTSSEKAQLSALEFEAQNLERQLSTLRKQEDFIRKELVSQETILKVERLNKEELVNTAQRLVDELSAASNQQKLLRESLSSAIQLSEKVKEELRATELQLAHLGDHKLKTRQDKETNDAVVNMKSLFKGVYGKLVDLCRPIQKKYSKAVSVAAGKFMDAVVVENRSVAADCVRYMKEHRIGVFTFLPLDNLSEVSHPERLHQLDPSFHPCIKLVEFDEKFGPAVAFALDSCIVCENLSVARKLCFEKGETVKVVTLSGQVIGRSGAMTGGSLKERSDRWEEKDMDALQQKRSNLERDLSSFNVVLEKKNFLLELSEKIRYLNANIEFCRRESDVVDVKLRQLESVYRDKSAILDTSLKQGTLCTNDLAQVHISILQIRKAIHDVEKDVFADFSAAVGVDNVLSYEREIEQRNQQIHEEFHSLSKLNASLKAQLEYELGVDLKSDLIRLEDEIKSVRRGLEKLAVEESALQALLKAVEDSLNDNLTKLQSLKKDKCESAESLSSLKKAHEQLIADKEVLMKKASAEELVVDRAASDLSSLLKQSVVDEVSLPLQTKKGSLVYFYFLAFIFAKEIVCGL